MVTVTVAVNRPSYIQMDRAGIVPNCPGHVQSLSWSWFHSVSIYHERRKQFIAYIITLYNQHTFHLQLNENRYLFRLAFDFGLRLSGLRILLEMALLMLPPLPPPPLLLLLLEVRRLMSMLCSTSPANKPCSASIERNVQINWS